MSKDFSFNETRFRNFNRMLKNGFYDIEPFCEIKEAIRDVFGDNGLYQRLKSQRELDKNAILSK